MPRNEIAARNEARKAARIARAVIDLKTITDEDVRGGILQEHGVQSALLRSILIRNSSERVERRPVGGQRWLSATPATWAAVEEIVIALLED